MPEKDTAPVAAPDLEIEEILVKHQASPQQTTCQSKCLTTVSQHHLPIASYGKLLDVAFVRETPALGLRPKRKRTLAQDITIKEKGMSHLYHFLFGAAGFSEGRGQIFKYIWFSTSGCVL